MPRFSWPYRWSVPPAVAGGLRLNTNMWNDTDVPLAYLITVRTYGTWLHGDKRGSTSRHKNVYGTAKLKHEPNWLQTNRSRMTGDAVRLNAKQRSVVKSAIRETCEIRGWGLQSINVRSNHAHVVIRAPNTPAGRVLNAIKANATRELRERGLWMSPRSPWSDKGSAKYLWNEESVSSACAYVEYWQGEDLAESD